MAPAWNGFTEHAHEHAVRLAHRLDGQAEAQEAGPLPYGRALSGWAWIMVSYCQPSWNIHLVKGTFKMSLRYSA